MLASCLSAIHTARPSLTTLPRAIVDAVALAEGPIGTATAVARRLGLDRFRLARLLRREGVPPLHRLSGWAIVLSWVLAAEQDGVSLCWIAFHTHRHPSACYRLVKEVTGLSWSEVRLRGSGWIERELLRQFKPG